MNPEANRAYQDTSVNDGRLEMPVLFLHGEYDYTCRDGGLDAWRSRCGGVAAT